MQFYGMALENDPAYLAAGKERDAGLEERNRGGPACCRTSRSSTATGATVRK